MQNFVRLKFDYFVFINKKIKFIISIYVNDLLIIDFKKSFQIAKFKTIFNRRFEMTDLKSCHYYVNMFIIRNRFNKFLHMSQKFHVDKMFIRFNIIECKSVSIFMNIETKLKFNFEQINVTDVKLFQIIMNNLIYLIYSTRLNIEYNIQFLSRFNINSFKKKIEIVKKILQYLKEIKKIVITYEFDKDFDDFYATFDWRLFIFIVRKCNKLIVKVTNLRCIVVLRNWIYDANSNLQENYLNITFTQRIKFKL